MHATVKGTMKIQGVTLLKVEIKKILLQLSSTDSYNVENIIYPKDKQNVPTATASLLKFIDDITKDDKSHLIQTLSNQKQIKSSCRSV